jgi:hypothetical protein
MNDHDRDLILALAAGELDDQDAEAARARIDADPELAAALDEQMAVRSHLMQSGASAMTPSERAEIRRNLIAELHLDTATSTTPAAAVRRGVRWWQPVLGVAAVAVVVTAIVVIPGGGSDDSDTGADIAALTTIPASGDVPTTPTSEDEAATDAGGATDGAAPETAEVPEFEEVDGADLLTVTAGQTDPGAMSDALEEELAPQSRSLVDVDSVEACLETLAQQIPDGDTVLLGEEQRDTGRVVFLGVIDPETGVEAVVTIDLAGCRVVDVDE